MSLRLGYRSFSGRSKSSEIFNLPWPTNPSHPSSNHALAAQRTAVFLPCSLVRPIELDYDQPLWLDREPYRQSPASPPGNWIHSASRLPHRSSLLTAGDDCLVPAMRVIQRLQQVFEFFLQRSVRPPGLPGEVGRRTLRPQIALRNRPCSADSVRAATPRAPVRDRRKDVRAYRS